MKKCVVLIGSIIIIIIFVMFIGNYEKWIAYNNLSRYSSLTEEQIIKSMSIIARKYTNKNVNCSISSDANHLISTQEVIDYGSVQIPPQELESNKKIIFLEGDDSSFNKNFEPIQIYGMFDCLLYLKEKNIPFELYGICWVYTSGGISNSYSQKTLITKTEFDKLYNTTDLIGLTDKQAAKILADKWIEQTGFVKK